MDGLAVPVPALVQRSGAAARCSRQGDGSRSVPPPRGKTTFLWQVLADRLPVPACPREGLLYFSFEDERLARIDCRGFQWVIPRSTTRFFRNGADRAPGRPSSWTKSRWCGSEGFVRACWTRAREDVPLQLSAPTVEPGGGRPRCTGVRSRHSCCPSASRVLRHAGAEPQQRLQSLDQVHPVRARKNGCGSYLMCGRLC